MKSTDSRTLLEDDREGMFEALQSINPRLRFSIGLFSCAVIAYYVPLILIALTGVWVNNLTIMVQFAVGIVILVTQNLIGARLHKIFAVAVIWAVAFDCYEAVSLMDAPSWSAWLNNWMVFFFPTAACLLNAWLFLRFKASANLK